MKYIEDFREKTLIDALVKKIRESNPCEEIKLMEVCGTHTMAVARFALKRLLPENIKLVSGPGCPVCVTSEKDILYACTLAREGCKILTFGDMFRVPAKDTSLEKEKADGADIQIIYSPWQAIEIAKMEPKKEVVFFAIGFETTSPTVACTIMEAKKEGIKNLSIICSHKLIPPAMEALLNLGVGVKGFICPGHVSTIIGSTPYEFIPKKYGIPCVITGFEPVDIMEGIYMLIEQIAKKEAKVQIQYRRSVKEEGNKKALEILYSVFEKNGAEWRGVGRIDGSGLNLISEYKDFDASFRFGPPPHFEIETKQGCICAKIICGISEPFECSFFAKVCTPVHPLGPCMVSSEGACAAYYKYGR